MPHFHPDTIRLVRQLNRKINILFHQKDTNSQIFHWKSIPPPPKKNKTHFSPGVYQVFSSIPCMLSPASSEGREESIGDHENSQEAKKDLRFPPSQKVIQIKLPDEKCLAQN